MFWFNFACFGFKIWFLKKFLDRSVSFLGQETHEHVKTIKKRFLETSNVFFAKIHFKKICFPGRFPFRGCGDPERMLCLDSFVMFRFFLQCLDFFGMFKPFLDVYFFSKCLDLKPTCQT